MQPQEEIVARASDYMKAGDAAATARVCLEGLGKYPDDPNILCLAGRALIALERIEEAAVCIKKVYKGFPEFSLANETYGDLLLLRGDYEGAINAYKDAVKLDPKRIVLSDKIDRTSSLANVQNPGTRQARPRRKEMASADRISEAAEFERNGEPNKAEDIYRDILKQDPDHVEAIRLLAAVAVKHKKFREAEVFLQRAVSLTPDYARVWMDLSNVQRELDEYGAAMMSTERLLELTPRVAESHIAMAAIQAKAGLDQESIQSYQKALKITPSHPAAFSGMAHQFKTIGRNEDAIATHRQNIAANPGNADAYWNLANMKTFRFEDGEVSAMKTLLERDDLDDLSRVQLCNSLGLEFEGRKNYDQAFEYFQRCCELRRESENYDPVNTETTTDSLVETFNQEFIAKKQGNGVSDVSPRFVIGLPRSGSTLIEQILASHSQVEGTHELSDLPLVVRTAAQNISRRGRFPEVFKDLGVQGWSRIGNQYLERTQKYRTDANRFIDKNPNNFIYVGLLHLILPNAKIINARRHPMDSCFGSYKQLFASGQPFSYDLEELGEYYIQYQRLMDHWHAVLPGEVLDVDYEDVVADLESQVSRLLDYCELPMEDACLNFHETERAIKTASSEQVRQPIYSSSVDLWRHYEAHLGELIEVLQPLLDERYED